MLTWKKRRRRLTLALAEAWIWESTCGRYRIAEIRGPYPRFAVAVRIDARAASESIIANDRRTLAAAIKAAERHERDQ